MTSTNNKQKEKVKRRTKVLDVFGDAAIKCASEGKIIAAKTYLRIFYRLADLWFPNEPKNLCQ